MRAGTEAHAGRRPPLPWGASRRAALALKTCRQRQRRAGREGASPAKAGELTQPYEPKPGPGGGEKTTTGIAAFWGPQALGGPVPPDFHLQSRGASPRGVSSFLKQR